MSALVLSCTSFVTIGLMCMALHRVSMRIERLEEAAANGLGQLSHEMQSVRPLNAHANMLGQVVDAKKYEASDWETYVVCAVSWHGSLCLRAIGRPDKSGFWVHHDKVAERVREVTE